ncbi:MAG: deoxyuridine 5'-triphosphate nucleotidohydrolase [Clostridia bacterium]|nr:deoxyuridine 5'-triphosphate nucleotidohydrolase [Clostridia bacterium]
MTIAKFLHVSEDQYASSALPEALPVEEIPLPRRATAGSAGYDFICPAEVSLQPGEAVTIPTGVRCEMQPGWVLMLFPRSGLGFKYQVRLANTVGVIDADYFHAANEGHIMARIVNGGDHAVNIAKGERFCQGVFLPHGLAEEDEVLSDRTGGFGSTGR